MYVSLHSVWTVVGQECVNGPPFGHLISNGLSVSKLDDIDWLCVCVCVCVCVCACACVCACFCVAVCMYKWLLIFAYTQRCFTLHLSCTSCWMVGSTTPVLTSSFRESSMSWIDHNWVVSEGSSATCCSIPFYGNASCIIHSQCYARNNGYLFLSFLSQCAQCTACLTVAVMNSPALL